MDSRIRTLTFGDDRSSGADTAWDWITAHPWTGRAAEVVTVTVPSAPDGSVLVRGARRGCRGRRR